MIFVIFRGADFFSRTVSQFNTAENRDVFAFAGNRNPTV
jgi:hypothetical protein